MDKPQLKLVAAIVIVLLLIVLIILFLLPKPVVSLSKRLTAQKSINFADERAIDFASEEILEETVTGELVACPDNGELVVDGGDCPAFLVEEEQADESNTVNCDVTIQEPVCGSDENTYLNSCFATEAGIQFKPGFCVQTAAQVGRQQVQSSSGDENTGASAGGAGGEGDNGDESGDGEASGQGSSGGARNGGTGGSASGRTSTSSSTSGQKLSTEKSTITLFKTFSGQGNKETKMEKRGEFTAYILEYSTPTAENEGLYLFRNGQLSWSYDEVNTPYGFGLSTCSYKETKRGTGVINFDELEDVDSYNSLVIDSSGVYSGGINGIGEVSVVYERFGTGEDTSGCSPLPQNRKDTVAIEFSFNGTVTPGARIIVDSQNIEKRTNPPTGFEGVVPPKLETETINWDLKLPGAQSVS